MKFKLEPYHRNVSDADLIADVQKVAKKINRPTVTIDEYNTHGQFHATTLTRRFKSWFSVLEEAHLTRTRNLNISIDELFQNIVDVWTKLGRQPKYSDMIIPLSRYSYHFHIRVT